jgi:hypothetical protein
MIASLPTSEGKKEKKRKKSEYNNTKINVERLLTDFRLWLTDIGVARARFALWRAAHPQPCTDALLCKSRCELEIDDATLQSVFVQS